jgi:hypothetical protein
MESVFGKDIPTLMESAFADMLILAECDKIIASSFSTYSYTAHGMASNPPIVITQAQLSHQQRVDTASAAKGAESLQFGVNLWSNHRTTFVQSPTSQPCFHFCFNWRTQDVTCFQPSFVDADYFDGQRQCYVDGLNARQNHNLVTDYTPRLLRIFEDLAIAMMLNGI